MGLSKKIRKKPRSLRRIHGGTPVAQVAQVAQVDSELGIYNFSETTIEKLYVCSDLEGSNPFKFGTIDEQIYDDGMVYDMKMEYKIPINDIEMKDGENMVLTNNDVNGTVVDIFKTDLFAEDGIITHIDKNVALAYTGDLFDNRPYSLRLLKAMKQLKKDNLGQVIIIGGNRDYNKLRLGIELFMVDNKTGKHPFQPSEDGKLPTLESLVNSKSLKYIMETVPAYLIHDNWKDNGNKLDEAMVNVYINEEPNANQRLKNILSKSFGAKYQAYTREVDDLFSIQLLYISRELSDTKLNRLLSLLFMAMCFDWGEDKLVSETKKDINGDDVLDKYGKTIPDEDGIMFNSLKGLIYRYMELMHPVAYFDFGGDTSKNGFLSHSGVMDFTAPLGFNPDAGTDETDMKTIMRLLLEDKNTLLDEYNKLKDNPKNINNPDEYLTLVRYIGITAPPHEQHSIVTKGPAKTNDFKTLNLLKTLNLPSVGGSRIYDKIFTSDMLPTDAFIDKYPSMKNLLTLRLIEQTGQSVKYNIFGHEPNPFFPTVDEKGKTLNIGLDVCKNDFGDKRENNNYSFAILQINKKKDDIDKFIGRTKFGYNTDMFEKFNDIKYRDKIIYYNTDITTFSLKFHIDNKGKKHKQLILNLNSLYDSSDELNLQIRTAGDFSRHFSIIPPPSPQPSPPAGGSKHICSKNCKKCHKHDHKCLLKCRLCHDHMIVKKSSKVRKSRKAKKARKTRNVGKRMARKTRKNVKRRSQKRR